MRRNTDSIQSPQALISAISRSSLGEVELLIEQGADINVQNSRGNSPLALSMINNQLGIARLLINRGANLELQNKNGGTPLLNAINKNQINSTKLLMDNGANINTQTKNGNSLISIALIKNHTEIAKLLIQNGANLELASQPSHAPLTQAVKTRHIGNAKLLIKLGATVSEDDEINFRRYGDIYEEISTLASTITHDETLDLIYSTLHPYQLATIALDLAQPFNQAAIQLAPHIINNPDITRLFLLSDHLQTKLVELVSGQQENLKYAFPMLCNITKNLELCIEPSSDNIDVINEAFEFAKTFHDNNGHLSTSSDCKTFANLLNLLLNPNLLEQQYDDLNSFSLTAKVINKELGGRAIFESEGQKVLDFPNLDGLSGDVMKVIGTHIAADFDVSQLPEIGSLLKLHQQAGYQPKNNLENKMRLERAGNEEKEEITTQRENNSHITTSTEESKLSRAVDKVTTDQQIDDMMNPQITNARGS